MSQKPETLFRQKVVKDLKTLSDIAIFSIQQRTIKGDPDLMICLKGWFIALELKSVEGKPEKLQNYKHEAIRRAHGIVHVVYPDIWKAIFSELKTLGERK